MLASSGSTAAQAAGSSGDTAPGMPAPSFPSMVVSLDENSAFVVLPKPDDANLAAEASALFGPASSGSAADTAASATSPVTQPEVAPRKPWEVDPVYSQWVGHIEAPMEPVRALRGAFTDTLKCATLFGGLSSERKSIQLHNIPNTWMFTADKKHSAIQFSDQNFERASVHYLDALNFIDSLEGKDLYSGGEFRSLKEFFMKVDVLFVSTSCRPFSAARSKRKSEGTSSHDDHKLLDAFFRVTVAVQPLAMIFEQVFGFALSESTKDPTSPLQRFLERCDIELANFERTVFITDGSVWLVFARHRIYIVFIRSDAGGKMSMEALKAIVKADDTQIL